MGFVTRRYDPSVIESLALAGVLEPELTRAQRIAALDRAAIWLGSGDREARWAAELLDDGSISVSRIWRGVTDVFPVEAAFLTSAEARKLARLSAETAEVYAAPARLVKAASAAEEPEPEAAGDETDEAEAAPVRAVAGDGSITRPSQLLDTVLAAGR